MMRSFIQLLLQDPTLQVIILGASLLGALCGALGTFAVLKKQSLIGDAIAHASLPGIVIAFLILGEKNSIGFLIGALLSGVIGAMLIKQITTKTYLKSDTALGIVLSTFFGFGMLLLTYVQKQPNANQSGLTTYLFGQAATLMWEDVWLMVLVIAVMLLVLMLLWKEIKIMLFDSQYALTIGFKVSWIDTLVTFFIVAAIILGLQTVGVVLMSAMLLAPAAAARQWTNSLFGMWLVAILFGAVSGFFGVAISASYDHLSTGPVIVLIASVLVVFSFLLAPQRGLLFKALRVWQNRNDLKMHKSLLLMYQIVKDHPNVYHPHNIKLLNHFQGYTLKSITKLQDKGYIQCDKQFWWFTENGFVIAKNLYHKYDASSN